MEVKLGNLREWWFNSDTIWFDSTEYDDLVIANKYENLFLIDFDKNTLVSNIYYGVGYIILYDQISRHIKRARNYPDEYIGEKLEKLLEFIHEFYQTNCNKLNGYDFCFALLPLRHTKDFTNTMYVIDETWAKIFDLGETIGDENLKKIYKRFLKASYDNAPNGKIYEITNQPNQQVPDNNFNIETFINEYSDILDTSCHNYKVKSESDILELNDLMVKNIFRIKNNLPNNLIVSISGGIDSMVLSWILNILKINYQMVHINYANRDIICEREKLMLYEWAKYLNVKLYIRDINEINRNKCMGVDLREMYETYTRDKRYESYIDVAKENNWEDNSWGVLMGHNHDDCFENIFTNILNKTKYENLYGMTFKSNILFNSTQIWFIRPMLKISKESIYNYAHMHNIPYLFDSTPKWSQRGKIRDLVRPVLIEWNKNIIDGFDELTGVLEESIELIDLLVDKTVNQMIKYVDLDPAYKINKNSLDNLDTLKMDISELKSNKIFWSRIINKISNIYINSKFIEDFIIRINTIKNKFNTKAFQPKKIFKIEMGKSKINNNSQSKIYYWKTLDNYIIFCFDII